MAHSKNYVWWTERDKIGVAKTSDYGDTFTSPTENDEVRIFGSKLATAISEDTPYNTQSEIPAQFREALIYKVNELIYEKNPDTLPLAQYNNAKYMDMVMEAKKYGNTERTEGYSIKGYDY